MKISAINNYRFNNVNFESKKQKNVQTPAHTSSPVKAIPVALLMAMSPLNITNSVAQVPQSKLEMIQGNQDELVGQYICSNATTDGKPGIVNMYMSRDGEEYLKLNISKDFNTYIMGKNNDVIDAIKTLNVEIRPEEFLIENISYYGKGGSGSEKKYYVIGSGIQYTDQIKNAKTGEPIKKSYSEDVMKVENRKFEITEEFYKLITENHYNTSPTVEENITIFSSNKTLKGL